MAKMHIVDEFWHADMVNLKNPDDLVGKTFVHLKTKTMYIVEEAVFNAGTDKWALVYVRVNEDKRRPFRFVRDMDEFLDGRFMELQ